MSRDARVDEAMLPLSMAKRVDAVSFRFELAWKAAAPNQRPSIADYLGDIPEPERSALWSELVTVDIACRRRAGEDPKAQDYRELFPTLDLEELGQRLGLLPDRGSRIEDRGSRIEDPRLGKFQLLERVGEGAFGAVWRARDTELDRIVALKIPHTGWLTDPAERERFHREARAAARLRHPGIVPVHDVLTLEGLPAIVSDFVEGLPLKELLQQRRLTFGEAASLVAEVGEAIHYAHEMGVVHRDLKPANIMIASEPPLNPGGSTGEMPFPSANRVGKPLVMDFGLALRGEAEVTMTQDGHILGTPAYMSPEQAAGKSHQADRRSDVYSLGVVLYELLTGKLPFRGSRSMLLHQVLREAPRRPRRLNDKIPRDLETICLRCLEKTPNRRYHNALELAAELRRFLAGKPILARPVGRVELAWRWCRRNPLVATLAAAVVVLLTVIAVGGTVISLHLQETRIHAEKARAEVAQARRQSDLRLLDAYVALARGHRGNGQAGLRLGALGAIKEAVALARELGEPAETFDELRNLAIAALAPPGVSGSREHLAVSVGGLRALRSELNALGLDWAEPSYPPATSAALPAADRAGASRGAAKERRAITSVPATQHHASATPAGSSGR